MRRLALIALAAAPLALAACATAGETTTAAALDAEAAASPAYAAELDRMANECAGQGGVLTPSGRHTGEVERDSICRTNGYVVAYD